jgi:hypothetical protein
VSVAELEFAYRRYRAFKTTYDFELVHSNIDLQGEDNPNGLPIDPLAKRAGTIKRKGKPSSKPVPLFVWVYLFSHSFKFIRACRINI